ncbi:FGGY family carbohydrate kinase [Spirilliplanes yamanashiensis]|uniref:Xylulose kinase n=1 Tax=Spirilliplanes yamanashiensis TaxID=42233 RepID=A0A8J3Y6S5_9ACTN|nr:FGGY family carbohydrate kinase [Spirilliplanes yamanashiensis]MDP9817432.1 sugar (pentulose or hexulose) kinase [Spirilliplanes yamanashiensis]GIJ02916.1 xylulose kinase [Spirilliplanes yamanashiensis]
MSPADGVVGIDLGTTSTKVLLRDVHGRRLSFVEGRTPWTTTPDGGTETTAEALTGFVVGLLRTALARAEATSGDVRVLGLGVAGLAESGVLLDGAGRAGTPVIAWFDRRGEEQVARVSRRHPGFPRIFVRRTGLPWDCQASVAKLMWFADQGLTTTAQHRWLSVPEYLVRFLGGDTVSEPSLASRTGLLDQAGGRPWQEGADTLGLAAGLLAEPRPSGVSAGRLRCGALPANVQGAVLTVAGHDHPVAAIGAGATGADELFNSTGTADVIARSLPGRLTDDQRERLVGHGISVGAHILPDTTLLLGGVRGGLLLRRVLGLLGATDGLARDRLDAAALDVGPLPAGLELSGAGPTGDDVVLRVRDDAGPPVVWAAATRYTAAETRKLLTTLHGVVRPHRRAVASGGWTRMASVRRAKAAAIDHLEFADIAEPGVAGAALVALRAASAPAGVPLAPPSPV